jgi:hypothetical protein
MARRSHWKLGVLALSTFATLSTTGCIVADAPDYGAPQRSPIFMFNPHPAPGSLQFLTREPADPVEFGATIKSEDAGEQLASVLYFDYKHRGEHVYDENIPLPPLTIEQERPVKFYVDGSRSFLEPKTCHTVTLMVMHLSSYDQETNQFKGPPDDRASVTWFASVDDDGTILLKDCPTAAGELP